VLALRTRAEAARAAAEAAPVEPDAGASLPPPLPSSGNTDERAGFEEARDAPAVPGAPRVASTPDAGSASIASTAPAAGAAPAVSTAAGAAPSPAIAPAAGTAPASAPGPSPSARAPDAPSISPEPAVGASPSPVTRASPTSLADVRTRDASVVAPIPAPASIDREPRTSIVASAPSPAPRPAALRRIEDAAPVYPTRARARGIEGWVDVAFTVDAAGRVTGARVISAAPAGAFAEAALDAVRRWRYAPPPAPQDANVRLRFRLDR
jgi:protein TonB